MLLVAAVLVVAAVGWFVYSFGPRNVIGMLRYDQRQQGKLMVGDAAPDVALLSLDGTTPVRLKDSIGGKPLVLVFGSFTWPPFRRSVERVRAMHRQYGSDARFLTLYIKEAHPEDEWQMDSNAKERDNVCYKQPKTTAERVAIANDFVKRFHYELPLLVDPIENRANAAYAGWPERFYIVDENGIIVYKGKPGPFGYHPEEVEAWLAKRFPGGAAGGSPRPAGGG